MPNWLNDPIIEPNVSKQSSALNRQNSLTKPPGSLGQLESIAVQFSAWHSQDKPQLNNIQISIFAGDHGIADEHVSAFPQSVTAEMVKNFVSGGAAISILAKHLNAHFEIVDVGIKDFPNTVKGVISQRVANGTANFTKRPAMSNQEMFAAMQAGYDAIERSQNCDLFIGGEMGIANTSSATAIACLLLSLSPTDMTGAGTGLGEEEIQHKVSILEKALVLHGHSQDPYHVLSSVGGFEIAALTGSYLRCAQKGIPILVDGFISSAAALVATRIQPESRKWMLFGHMSAERGHRYLLEALKAEPILKLSMRLGEASGAAIAVPIIQQALLLHNKMATFDEANVSEKAT